MVAGELLFLNENLILRLDLSFKDIVKNTALTSAVWFCCSFFEGESGLGKSTLVNSLFLTDLYKDRKLLNAEGKEAAAF